MNQTFRKDLDQLLNYAMYQPEQDVFSVTKENFIKNYEKHKGQIYVPSVVVRWFNSEYVTNQRKRGMSLSEVFINIDNNEYDLFTEAGVGTLDWDNVLTWIEEHEKDFALLWLGEDYTMLVEQELYYLWNPFEQGYSGNLGYTTNPIKDGYKYTMDEIKAMSDELVQFAVRIDEV